MVSVLFPIWFIAHCVSRLTHLNIIRFTAGNFYLLVTLIVNVIGIVLGAMMLFRPALAAYSADYLISIYLLLMGVDSLVMAVQPPLVKNTRACSKSRPVYFLQTVEENGEDCSRLPMMTNTWNTECIQGFLERCRKVRLRWYSNAAGQQEPESGRVSTSMTFGMKAMMPQPMPM